MFGSHLSIAGGLHNALIEASELGMDCVQVFTKNQRQWRSPPLTEEQIRLWNQHRRATGMSHVVSHDSYLINLACPRSATRERSIDLFRDELLRCEALDIPWLVTHPGAHMGEGEAAGLRRVVEALNQVHQELPGLRTITCLEVTAGQGTGLGWRFEHIRELLDRAAEPDRLAVCLDTAHLLAAGYDLTCAAGCRETLERFDRAVGLGRVRVWHLNDSKAPLGSRKDRHEHIGHGHVSLEAFRVIVTDGRFRATPKILETPKEKAPDGRPWDLINLELLRRLARPRKALSPAGAKKPLTDVGAHGRIGADGRDQRKEVQSQ